MLTWLKTLFRLIRLRTATVTEFPTMPIKLVNDRPMPSNQKTGPSVFGTRVALEFDTSKQNSHMPSGNWSLLRDSFIIRPVSSRAAIQVSLRLASSAIGLESHIIVRAVYCWALTEIAEKRRRERRTDSPERKKIPSISTSLCTYRLLHATLCKKTPMFHQKAT